MPIVAGSQITKSLERSAAFDPVGDFTLCVTEGSVRLLMQLPGRTDWLYSGELVGRSAVSVTQNGGTAVRIAQDISGTKWVIEPVDRASAEAWT